MYANKIHDLAQVFSFLKHLLEDVEEIVESRVFVCILKWCQLKVPVVRKYRL